MILYPVAIQNPDGSVRHKPAKVYAHDGYTEVYVWDRDAGDAAQVMRLEGSPVPNGFRQWKVTTGEGDVLIAATGGCGCSHPLKRWSPPRPVIA